jgi:hypothetical protein
MRWRQAAVDSLKGMFYFVVLGPPIGALVLTVVFAGMAIGHPHFDPMALLGLLGFAMLAMLYSWLFAAIPAALTGLLVGPLRWRFHQWRWCLVAGAVGGAVSSIGVLVGLLSGDMGRASPGLMLVFPGFVAGVLVARIFGLRATYPPSPMPPLPQRAGMGESP